MSDQIDQDQEPIKDRCFLCGKAITDPEAAGHADDDGWFICKDCQERISRKAFRLDHLDGRGLVKPS